MNIIVWGSADHGKPRVRIMLRGLREVGVATTEIWADIWSGIDDKARMGGAGRALWLLVRLIASYPVLIWKFMRAPKPDAVLVCYPGHLDVLVLWPFARWRGVPVLWDVFLSAYNTVVEDRGMLRRGGIGARLLKRVESLSLHVADRVLMDTASHAQYLVDEFAVPADKVGHVPVGVEPDAFEPHPEMPFQPSNPVKVLFYGQFIPLHGIETIVAAAQSPKAKGVAFTIIGSGQTEAQIREMLDEQPVPGLVWHPWVRYETLIEEIHAADICLGVFGAGEKAGRVIPNKVYQILAAGMPLITQNSQDLEILVGQNDAIGMIPPGDPNALLDAIVEMAGTLKGKEMPFHRDLKKLIEPTAVGQVLRAQIEIVTA